MFIITQDTSKSPIAAEQHEEIANSDTACSDDVDDNVLSDEALDKLDKELKAESSDEKELGVNRTGAVLNGTDGEEIHEVVSLSWRPFTTRVVGQNFLVKCVFIMPEMEKHIKNSKIAKFKAPGIKE